MKSKRNYSRLIIIIVILVVAIVCATMYLLDTKSKHPTIVDDQGNVVVHVIALDANTDLNNFDGLGDSDAELAMSDATIAALADLLNKDENFEAIILRPSETEANLEMKTTLLTSHQAEMVISIQGNHSSDTTISGMSAYAVPPSLGDNAASLKLANAILGKTTDEKHINNGIYYYYFMYEKPDLYTVDIVTSDDTTPRDSFTFGILTADKTIPSVIINQGYMTNPEDVEYYTSEKGINDMARAYYDAILEYYGV